MNTETPLSMDTSANETTQMLKPLGWKLSLLYFGFPALGIVAFYYWFRPWLQRQGYSDIVSYMTALCVPLALMLAAALVAYQRVEGRPLTRSAFAARMRYPRLRLADVFWGIGIAMVGIIGLGLLSLPAEWLINHGYLPLPAGLPFFDNPLITKSMEALNQAAGGQIRGQWPLLVLFLILYFFNIIGEELWWRGIILPRQELVFGRFTWLVHGLMWACFHIFKYWDILTLVPVCLSIAWISQKRQNNWAGLIAHAIVNGVAIPYILAAVAGWL